MSFKVSVSDAGKETEETYLPDTYTVPDRKIFVDTSNCEGCGNPFTGLFANRHHW